MRPLPTLERVKEVLAYDPDTGVFRWLVSRNHGPAFREAGAIAGAIYRQGYVVLSIDQKRVAAQRVAFLLMVGRWPDGDVDHINGKRADNRWANLREATRSENNQNIRGPRKDNRTGLLGVRRHVRASGVYWSASIQVNKKPIYLGCFSTGEEAQAAYMKAKARLHPFAPKHVPRTQAAASSNGAQKCMYEKGPRA